jgi:hypothetical protein
MHAREHFKWEKEEIGKGKIMIQGRTKWRKSKKQN